MSHQKFKVCCLGSKQSCSRNASSSNPAVSFDGIHNPRIDMSSQLRDISFIAREKSFCTVDRTVTSSWHWGISKSENEEMRCNHHLLPNQDDSALEGRRGSLSGSRQCLAPRLRPLLRAAARAAQPGQHLPLQRCWLPASREGDPAGPRQLSFKHSILRRRLQLCRGEEVRN